MEITLSELLESRDNRRAKQRALVDLYRLPVVSLTLVMPGAEKKNKLSARIAVKAVEAIKESFGGVIVNGLEYDLDTGFEALYVVSISKDDAKKQACAIEDEHPWGRLFDIDVIGEDGLPMSRELLGLNPRKCLVCDREARVCMRNQTHSLPEVLNEIELIINS